MGALVWDLSRCDSPPDLPTSISIEAEHYEIVHTIGLLNIKEVRLGLIFWIRDRLVFFFGPNRREDEDSIVPYDRRGGALPFDGYFPLYILSLTPQHWRFGSRRPTGRVGTSPLMPIAREIIRKSLWQKSKAQGIKVGEG